MRPSLRSQTNRKIPDNIVARLAIILDSDNGQPRFKSESEAWSSVFEDSQARQLFTLPVSQNLASDKDHHSCRYFLQLHITKPDLWHSGMLLNHT